MVLSKKSSKLTTLRLKRQIKKARPWFRFGLLSLLVIFFILLINTLSYPAYLFVKGLIKGPQMAISLVQSPETVLKTYRGYTNFLFLGMGGQEHIGGDLTDSVIFIAFNHQTDQAVFISLPRDLWLPSLKAKINTAYHYGEEKKPGSGGLILAQSAVSEVLGLPVHYVATLDFQGFIKAVDLFGGLDIEVDRAFEDHRYPLPGKENVEPEEDRYEHLVFDAGWQHFDGVTALKFARSRYAEGEEGTDFARSARQQKIIAAFLQKLISLKTFSQPQKINELALIIGDSIHSNLDPGKYPSLVKIGLRLQSERFSSFVLDVGQEEGGLLVHPQDNRPYQGQWVLVPPQGSWDKIHEMIDSLLFP